MKALNSQTTTLVKDNAAVLITYEGSLLKDTPYYGMLTLIAEMFDMIAQGENAYMVIGSTSNKSAFSVTLNAVGGKDARYAASLEQLAMAMESWL